MHTSIHPYIHIAYLCMYQLIHVGLATWNVHALASTYISSHASSHHLPCSPTGSRLHQSKDGQLTVDFQGKKHTYNSPDSSIPEELTSICGYAMAVSLEERESMEGDLFWHSFSCSESKAHAVLHVITLLPSCFVCVCVCLSVCLSVCL